LAPGAVRPASAATSASPGTDLFGRGAEATSPAVTAGLTERGLSSVGVSPFAPGGGRFGAAPGALLDVAADATIAPPAAPKTPPSTMPAGWPAVTLAPIMAPLAPPERAPVVAFCPWGVLQPAAASARASVVER
jgi:hypothetical protein